MSAVRVARVRAVVIGASAGGVEALGVLLPALPAALAAPVLVVVHLPSGRPSLLATIFGPACRVPVREAEDKEAIEPGTVVFAPPDYHLLVDRGPQTALSADEPLLYSRPAIDPLFESAADLWGEGLLAIVLTGSSEDGAAGLAAVAAAGGQAVVQLPASAAMPTMPEAAARRCPGAAQLTLEEIAAQLSHLPRRA